MKSSWLYKSSLSNIEVIVLATICVLSLFGLLWLFHFKDLHRVTGVARLAGNTTTEVKAILGEPREVLSETQHNEVVDSWKDSLEPDPEPQYGIDEAWNYYLGNNHYTYLYFKNGIVIRIYLGAT